MGIAGGVVVASLAGWAGGVRGLAGGGCGDTDRTADDERFVDDGGGDASVFGDGPAGGAMERAIYNIRVSIIVLESVLILCRCSRPSTLEARSSPQIATSFRAPLSLDNLNLGQICLIKLTRRDSTSIHSGDFRVSEGHETVRLVFPINEFRSQTT
jgi:hypothetical protein